MSEKILLTQNLSRLWASLIIDELIKNDISTFYLSPGMRNAPLIAALKARTDTTIKLGIDERAMAYRALGYAKVSGKTAVLICTSGTALANYMPAIIEAKKSGQPLMVISADRPVELATSDANQTIDQVKFYGEHVQGALNLGAPTTQIQPEVIASSISNLLFKSKYPQSGPVHMNCPFREPLDDTNTNIEQDYINSCSRVFNSEGPYTHYPLPEQSCSEEIILKIKNKLENTTNGLLVIGSLPAALDKKPIKDFIEKLNWPTFLDISSSLKYSYSLQDNVIPTFDHPEVFEQMSKDVPQTIVHIGGRTTSKHYYRFLEKYKNIEYITVNQSSEKEDPAHQTQARIIAGPDIFCSQILTKLENTSGCYSINWNDFVNKKVEIINNAPLSYPSISKKMVELQKQDSNLYIANSTVIRSFDNYISTNDTKDINVLSNRGVSGIEGLIASACGVSDKTNKATTLIIGDVSFIHDLNSLSLLKDTSAPVIIVLVNNYGGGIFSLLPIAKEKEILPYMTTPHEIEFKNAAQLFNINYEKVNTITDFERTYTEAIDSNESSIIELIVDNDKNIEIYKKLRTVRL